MPRCLPAACYCEVTFAYRIRESHQCSLCLGSVQESVIYMLGALSAPGAVVGAAVLADGPGAGAGAGK